MKTLFLALCLVFVYSMTFSQKANTKNTSETQFNFWLGDWNVYKYGTDTLVGISRIESILDSTTILENYHTPKGKYKGKSLNKYNTAEKRWEQYWVDNSDLVLHLIGNFIDGKMVLSGYTGKDDKKVLNRITWSQEGENVRQIWQYSENKGESWRTAFDGEYRPK